MASTEPPHKRQRRTPNAASPPQSQAIGDAQPGAGYTHGSVEQAFNPVVDPALAPTSRTEDGIAGAANGTDGSTADEMRDANEYAHLLVAQSARMLSEGEASADGAATQKDNSTAHAAQDSAAMAESSAATATLDAAGGAVSATQADSSSSAMETVPGQLHHPRLAELDLMLIPISHGAEPRRYGLVCHQCRTAVKPNQLAAHLTRKDSHTNFRSKTKRAQMAKVLVTELLDAINGALLQAGAIPETDLGGLGPSSLLSFADFFGPDADPTQPRAALPSLQIRQASKCSRCLRLVSTTHKKAHREEHHPEETKDSLLFTLVRAQELARNGGVLFEVLDQEQGPMVLSPPQLEQAQAQAPVARGEGSPSRGSAAPEPARHVVDEQALADQDHREALSSVLSAITAAADFHSDALAASTRPNGSTTDGDAHAVNGSASAAGGATTTSAPTHHGHSDATASALAPPPLPPGAQPDDVLTSQHADNGEASEGRVSEPEQVAAHLPTDLSDASDPTNRLLSEAEAAVAAPTAAVFEARSGAT